MVKLLNEKEIKKLWKRLKKYPNVVGFDSLPQPRIKQGKEVPNTSTLRIYVTKKVSIQELKPKEVIPRKLDLGSKEIETDIVEIGEIKALQDTKKRYRPIKAGISGCHMNCTACTISGFFQDKETGRVLVGLNNHCGALENKAKKGDPWVQPSPYDKGIYPKDEMADLHHFVEIKFNGFNCPFRNFFHKIYRALKRDVPLNKVDISFGVPIVDFEITSLGIPNAFSGYREPEVGDEVQKTGRTTGYTKGKIVSTSWTGSVQYSRGIAVFTDCIVVEGKGFSAGGDSGSPVFDMDGNLVGILFAGSDTHTILCKIKNIEEEGNVRVVTKKDLRSDKG